MQNRFLMIAMLLPAYVLLVLHSVIPHHHHAPQHEGPVRYHHGIMVCHHHHDTDEHHPGTTESQDPFSSHHFVHSPEFGHAMVKPEFNWMDFGSLTSWTFMVHAPYLLRFVDHEEFAVLRPPDHVVYLTEPLWSSHSLRGPPTAIPA